MTGGSAGIGFGIAAHLLQHNANATILSNKEEHAKSALEELKEYGDASKAHWVQCDLEDLKATDKVAKELAQSHKKIDGLILNAGLGVGVYVSSSYPLNPTSARSRCHVDSSMCEPNTQATIPHHPDLNHP